METEHKIFSIELTYHAELEPVILDCIKYGVLYQDLPSNWAGEVRLVGYGWQLAFIVREHWGEQMFYDIDAQRQLLVDEWLASECTVVFG